jgi:hypothetical protein
VDSSHDNSPQKASSPLASLAGSWGIDALYCCPDREEAIITPKKLIPGILCLYHPKREYQSVYTYHYIFDDIEGNA